MRVPVQPKHSNDGVLTLFKALLEIIVISGFVVTFIVQPFRIPSESMVPTLRVGDFLLVNKQSYGPDGGVFDHILAPETVQRGDLVVFHFPPDPSRDLVKRVVAIPGDRLHLRNGTLFLNGQAAEEPYAFHSRSLPDNYRDNFPSLRSVDPSADPRWWAQLQHLMQDGEVTVPAGEYFVMGDNRNNSEDSRYWGFVPRDALLGRPLLVYFTTNVSGTSARTPTDRVRDILTQVRVLH